MRCLLLSFATFCTIFCMTACAPAEKSKTLGEVEDRTRFHKAGECPDIAGTYVNKRDSSDFWSVTKSPAGVLTFGTGLVVNGTVTKDNQGGVVAYCASDRVLIESGSSKGILKSEIWVSAPQEASIRQINPDKSEEYNVYRKSF